MAHHNHLMYHQSPQVNVPIDHSTHPVFETLCYGNRNTQAPKNLSFNTHLLFILK